MRQLLLLSAIGICRNKTNLMISAAIGLSLYVAATFAWNIPSDIRLGWKGQAAIQMLDETDSLPIRAREALADSSEL